METLRRIEVRDTILTVIGSAPLIPIAGNRFRNAVSGATLLFSTRNGAIQLEETLPNGDKNIYQRMAARRVDAKTLASYVGDYYSEELAYGWWMEVKDGKLFVRLTGRQPVVLEPLFLDAFQTPAGVLRFQREASGKVTGFMVGAGRVTGFRFQRR